jgi:hypothetical protein
MIFDRPAEAHILRPVGRSHAASPFRLVNARLFRRSTSNSS